MINDGHFKNCLHSVLEGVHPCNFTNINQCGYVDGSPGVNKWSRFYDLFTRGEFGSRSLHQECW